MFLPVFLITEGDHIRIHGQTYSVSWIREAQGVTMIGIADTAFVSSNYASFQNTDLVEVMR
jgi:hypothetical protein